MKRTSTAALLALVALAAGGCKAKVGDPCEKGLTCFDSKTQLFCADGKFVAGNCLGPKGCIVESGFLTCDISGNSAGDVCSVEDEGNAACAVDGKNKIVCTGGRYAMFPCHGPDGCKNKACDDTLVTVGEPCYRKNLRCTNDGKAAIRCKDGKWAIDRQCASGCSVTEAGVTCEEVVAPPPGAPDASARAPVK